MRPDEPSPLSEPALYILLALAEEPRHGYGIILRVEEWTGGRLVLRTGTLYTALRRMADSGWIEGTEVDESEDQRRNYYRLTGPGRALIQSETSRIRELAELAGRVLG